MADRPEALHGAHGRQEPQESAGCGGRDDEDGEAGRGGAGESVRRGVIRPMDAVLITCAAGRCENVADCGVRTRDGLKTTLLLAWTAQASRTGPSVLDGPPSLLKSAA